MNKFEARNPKSETNSNDENLNDQNKNGNSKQVGAFVLNFEHLNFCICLKQRDFDIRISDLLASSVCKMEVTIFVTLSDTFFKIFKLLRTQFPIKSSKSLLNGHFYFLASNLLNVYGMQVKNKH